MNFNEKNDNSRKKISDILNRISDSQWHTEIGGGWTVGTMLCHIAFWDKMTIERLQVLKETGNLTSVPEKDNLDVINDSVRYMCSAFSLEAGKRLVIDCMNQVDLLVSQLTPDEIKILQESGRERWIQRNLHREIHLPGLEKFT